MLGIGVTEDAHEFFAKTLNQHPGERSTIKKHEIILNYLQEFSPLLPFGKINYAFVKEFYSWLSTQKSNRDKSKTLSKNYVASMMTTVRYYTNQAILNSLINKDPFLGFSPVKTKEDVPHLTREEIKAIEGLDLSNRLGSVEDSRNAFVFSCYTGLRVSDLFNLKAENIKKVKGDLIMNVEPIKTRNKTVTIVRIPLSKAFEGRPAEIITPYLEGKEKDDLLFGKNYKTHTSTYNQHLRKIQALAGVEVPLRSHIGRHSCGMMLVNEHGWDIAKVQKYLGHKDISMTQVYAQANYRTLEDGW
jgi:site-specific recombinase XerD